MRNKNNIKAIPLFIQDIWTIQDDYYINLFGIKRKYSKSHPNLVTENSHYTDIENGDLTINQVCYENGFYAVELGRISYNEKYNELTLNGMEIDDFLMICKSMCDEGMLMANAFIQKIFVKQTWYDDYCSIDDGGFYNNHVANIIAVFLKNQHKMLPLLMKYRELKSVREYIVKMFCSEVKENVIESKVLYLAVETNMDLELAIKSCKKFNPSEVLKFARLIMHFNRENINDLMKYIVQIENLDFTKFANYLIKQSFILGNFKMEAGETLKFVRLYEDYILISEDDIDRYPDDLQMAHDASIDRNSIKMDGSTYSVPEFRRATKLYEDLAWEDEDIVVEVPKSPQDLINESKHMHNCVKGYINKVINKRTKIVFFRKCGNPYITVEVDENRVIQARLNCNNPLKEDDKKILNKWAKTKKLIIEEDKL